MSDNNRPADDLPVSDDNERDEFDDMLDSVQNELNERAAAINGYFKPILPTLETSINDKPQDQIAVRLAWAMMGNMINEGMIPVPNADLCTDAEKAKFADHLNTLIMSLSMTILKTFPDGDLQ